MYIFFFILEIFGLSKESFGGNFETFRHFGRFVFFFVFLDYLLPDFSALSIYTSWTFEQLITPCTSIFLKGFLS